MTEDNVFAGAYVDRAGERRKDDEWLATAMLEDGSLFLPVWGDRCLVRRDQKRCGLLSRDEITGLLEAGELIFLGLLDERPAFAVGLPASEAPPLPEHGDYLDLRSIGNELPAREANLAAQARALVLWHQSEQFCGRCGAATSGHAGGNARICTSCDRVWFPRVEPAVIVLVADGDRCLMGRKAVWPEGLYSTIAGFVEPGESLEDAVRREVFEETNVRVGDVRYHSSQPWPFPSSLMLGFFAEADSTGIRLNDQELEDARWFTRDELAGDFPKLPQRVSIARRLIDAWLHGTPG